MDPVSDMEVADGGRDGEGRFAVGWSGGGVGEGGGAEDEREEGRRSTKELAVELDAAVDEFSDLVSVDVKLE